MDPVRLLPITLPLAIIVWVAIFFRIRGWLRQRRPRGGPAARLRQPTGARRLKPWHIVLLATLVAAGIGSAIVEERGPIAARRSVHAIQSRLDVVMHYVGIVLIVLVVLFLLIHWLSRDKVIIAAARLALKKQHDQAIQLLRDHIARNGETTQRLDALGLLLLDSDRYEEALAQFDRSQAVSRKPGSADNNRAVALHKLGRTDQALGLLKGVIEREPDNFVSTCNYCLFLADAGREQEAFEQLERAEQIYERYDPKYLKAWTPLLEECRQKLPTAHGFPVIVPSQPNAPT